MNVLNVYIYILLYCSQLQISLKQKENCASNSWNVIKFSKMAQSTTLTRMLTACANALQVHCSCHSLKMLKLLFFFFFFFIIIFFQISNSLIQLN